VRHHSLASVVSCSCKRPLCCLLHARCCNCPFLLLLLPACQILQLAWQAFLLWLQAAAAHAALCGKLGSCLCTSNTCCRVATASVCIIAVHVLSAWCSATCARMHAAHAQYDMLYTHVCGLLAVHTCVRIAQQQTSTRQLSFCGEPCCLCYRQVVCVAASCVSLSGKALEAAVPILWYSRFSCTCTR
jgi:hypothetical protein